MALSLPLTITWFSRQEFNFAGMITMLLEMAVGFLGISFLFFELSFTRRKKTALIMLTIGVLLVIALIFFRNYSLPVGSILFIITSLFVCFSYMPLLVKNRYEKWQQFTPANWKLLFLCIGDLLALTTNLLGYLFKIMHWPGGNILQYLGIVILILVFLGWNQIFKLVVRQRKEAEGKIAVMYSVLHEKHTEITDSINYAERLQRSLMATESMLNQYLPEHFIYFNPKEKVSGDFFWASLHQNGNFIFVCADSTGHGVPGAIMSMMNMNSLKEAVNSHCEKSNELLNKTREIIVNTLANDGSPDGGKDGMDAALLIFNQEKTKLEFSLANNPIWLIRKHPHTKSEDISPLLGSRSDCKERVLTEFKPDKMPVGKHERMSTSFTAHEIELKKNDLIILLTDGYADQFGGEKGKKFKYSNLQKLLTESSHLPLHEIRNVLAQNFQSWKGDLEQIDDVCIVGIRI